MVRFLTVAARIEGAADEMNKPREQKFDPRGLLSRNAECRRFPERCARLGLTTVTRLRTAAIFIRGWSGKHFRNRAPNPNLPCR